MTKRARWVAELYTSFDGAYWERSVASNTGATVGALTPQPLAPNLSASEPLSSASSASGATEKKSKSGHGGTGKRKARRFKLDDAFDGRYWTVLTPTRRAASRRASILDEEQMSEALGLDEDDARDGEAADNVMVRRNGEAQLPEAESDEDDDDDDGDEGDEGDADVVDEEDAKARAPVRSASIENRPSSQSSQSSRSSSVSSSQSATQGPAKSASGTKPSKAEKASYGHMSEAGRAQQTLVVAPDARPVMDVATGQVSMDGAYWMVSDRGRTRKARELQFFPDSHVVVAFKSSTAPKRVYTEEEVRAQKAKQREKSEAQRAIRLETDRREREEFAELVHFMSHGRVVMPGLYIGGRMVAENDAWLDATIDHVFNCSGKRFAYMARFAGRVTLVDVADDQSTDIGAYFAASSAHIAQLLAAGKRVLGKSRSAAVVVAYLVTRMPLHDALELVTTTNRGHNINPGFLRQLMQWEMSQRGLQRSTIHDSFHKLRAGASSSVPVGRGASGLPAASTASVAPPEDCAPVIVAAEGSVAVAMDVGDNDAL